VVMTTTGGAGGAGAGSGSTGLEGSIGNTFKLNSVG
jgi:hypothetical protein